MGLWNALCADQFGTRCSGAEAVRVGGVFSTRVCFPVNEQRPITPPGPEAL